MAKDLLFEIGAEEIPAGFMPNILGQLKQLAETKLNDAHLPFESIATYGTPRRLALIVKGLADTSAEISDAPFSFCVATWLILVTSPSYVLPARVISALCPSFSLS